MNEYKFSRVVPKSGIIALPDNNPFSGKEVEITITSRDNMSLKKHSLINL